MQDEQLSRDLARCVSCGLCLTACPTFRLTGMEGYSPRGRIAAVRAATEEAGGPVALLDEYLDTCLGCRACESVCPSGVPYGRILEHARAAFPRRRGPARTGESLSLWVLARPWRLTVASLLLYPLQKLGLIWLVARLARSGAAPRGLASAGGMPRLRLRTLLARMGTNYVPPDGVEERGQMVLFTGCVQDAWSRDVHWAAITVLTRAGYRVRVPHSQVCCGALHAHAGRLDAAKRLARRNYDPLGRYDGTIVVSAAGCGAKLKEYGDLMNAEVEAAAIAGRVRDVTEVVSVADVRRMGAQAPHAIRRVAVHDACHLNFVQGVREQPRALLRAAGYDVVDLPDQGRCCGAAGSYSVERPDWAEPLLEAKMAAVRAVEPQAVAVGNPGCQFWMASSPGAPPLYHPIQLLAMAAVAG